MNNDYCTNAAEFTYSFRMSEPSGWKCYLFGSKPGGGGWVYVPTEGNVPNAFVRWMMKVCLGCTWEKQGD